MKLFSTACLALVAASAWCQQTTYLGLYMQGKKVGYASYTSRNGNYDSKPAVRTDSVTVMSAGMLGSEMDIRIDSTTWATKSGAPLKMRFSMKSAGRGQLLDAVFKGKKAYLSIDNSGTKTTRTLDVPNGPIVDDPVTLVLHGGPKAQSFYILDPTTASFVKNQIRLVGKTKVKVRKNTFNALKVIIDDPRAQTTVYVSGKGDLLKADGPLGMEMIPESRDVALKAPDKYSPSIDLAFSTKIETDKQIDDPKSLTGLKLRLTGPDLSRIPSDAHQTVTKGSSSWVVDVHPTRFENPVSIAQAASEKGDWIKPGLNIPSDQANFKALAAKIVGDAKDVQTASLAIQRWVYGDMHANAGIGVLRNANEILKTKEGVCRDYAILTATILRAARIPTRLASGLVNWDGTFYYHAWNEVWDGHHWVGIDSTTDFTRLSAGHVKLADGNVEEAFTFTFLDKVKVEVLDTKKD